MSMNPIRIACVAALVSALPLLCVAQDERAILQRSLTGMGDTARLQHMLAKARRGEPVVVGVIGGSITAGARASKPELSWGNLAAKWWTDTFPQAKVTFVNAGIGATCSDLGAHRVQAHLLDRHPDIVMVEYAVNDGINPMAAETLEGLVRRTLKQPNQPAVLLLFTMDNKGANTQQAHMEIGKHYGLPMASFRDALWPEVEAKRIAWTDIESDEVHPNDRGHAYCASFMTDICARVLKDLPADKDLPAIAALPEPKTANLFENAGFYNAETITPTKNEGWEVFTDPNFAGFFGKGWKTAAPGSTLEFKVEGRAVSLLFYRIKGAMGIARAQVDDQPPVTMDAWFDADWGGYAPFQLVARDLAPGPHNLRVTVLGDRNPESTGNEFHINAVLIAGQKESTAQQ
jgi:lysophospholipase L1-like esterase